MPDSTAVSNKRQRLEPIDPSAPAAVTGDDGFIQDHDAGESGADDDDDDEKPKDKKAGRRKIKIEFIQDKSRRHITFSKRKAGIMKKAYELSTLTGTQVLLLVVSETGLVYTFTTAKLQPLVTQPEGKNLIQACLNAPHGQLPSSMPVGTPLGRSSGPMSAPGPHSPSSPAPPPNVPGGLAIGSKEDDGNDNDGHDQSVSGSADTPDANDRGGRKRRRASSTTNPPTTRSSAQAAPPPPPPAAPATSPSATQPPPPAATTSPHARQTMPLPNTMGMPGGAPQQQQQMQPQSPSYATYPGAADPNMYPGYGGQPQPGPPQGSPYGYVSAPPGHEQPQSNMTWGGAPGVQQNNHYGARR